MVIPTALREALRADALVEQGRHDSQPSYSLSADRARAMAAALRWVHRESGDNWLTTPFRRGVLTALEQEADSS